MFKREMHCCSESSIYAILKVIEKKKCLCVYTIGLPEMLNVKEGFHHDLNARDKDELRGPTFP